MAKLVFSGLRYRGVDPGNKGKVVAVENLRGEGVVVEVSDLKAEQLKKDYPLQWADAPAEDAKPEGGEQAGSEVVENNAGNGSPLTEEAPQASGEAPAAEPAPDAGNQATEAASEVPAESASESTPAKTSSRRGSRLGGHKKRGGR